MTADPEQASGDRERPTRNSSFSYNGSYPGAPAEESPDLLRWRADSLLDEMMLGGVDVSAADTGAPASSSRADGPSAYPDPNAPVAGTDSVNGSRPYANGYHEPEPDLNATDTTPFEPEPNEPDSRLSSQYPGAGSYRSVLDRAPAWDDDPDHRGRTQPDQTQGGEVHPRTDRLYSVEQQYEAFRRNQSSQVQPVSIPKPEPSPSASSPSASSSTPPIPPRERPDEMTQWANTPEKWEWQDFGAAPGELSNPERYVEPSATLPEPESAVRQDQAQFVSAMSVMGSGKRRSTLLPRMSTLDADALNQEIATLHGELGVLLPVGHESSERARHLLDKAYSILQSDPMRSAEVEYYMQQVRTIVLRLHQARRWSDLYRDRLRIYLMSWLFLSLLVLAASFVLQLQLETFALVLFNSEAMARHWPSFLGAIAAGALGGAAGALYTMSRHTRSVHSFFDRKYGLRGLMLPIIPALFGALIYLPIGLLYSLLSIDPGFAVADLLPMLAAFVFGISQESLYGTRG